MTELHPEIRKVLERIIDRSQDTRKKYFNNESDVTNQSLIIITNYLENKK